MSGLGSGFGGTSHEPTWTTRQVSEYLGLAVQTIYNMVSKETPGFPSPRKQGRLNAFIPSEVAAYRSRVLGLNEEKPAVAAAGQNTNL